MKKSIKTAVAAAVGTAAAAVGTKTALDMKNKKFCPVCEAKRLLHKVFVNAHTESGYNNGVAMTPPMGWSSWNLFASKINEDLIKEIADAMKNSGLLEAGYKYVNIDDCWQSSERDEQGRLQCDKATFPNGIKALSTYVNERGLKLGLYSSNGTRTCEDYPASLYHEAVDADSLAEWGIEYFKYDFCHNIPISEKAPSVAFVEFSRKGEKPFVCFSARDCSLEGGARIVREEDNDKDNYEYIKGLCSRNGSFYVNVESDREETVTLSLTIRKASDSERFLLVTVNKNEKYYLYCPKTLTSDRVKRAQCDIRLSAGINTVEFCNPVGSKADSAALQYELMGRELKRAAKQYAEKTGAKEKPIVFSLCEWGFNRPWKWGRQAGNLWRTTPDIKPFWASVMAIYEVNVRLWKHSACGGWNDPDMLEVGNGNLTYEENKSHFSLWCMMCAPLILGNDVRKFIKEDGTVDKENRVYKILTDKNLIAINQDKLGLQCRRIKCGVVDVLVKPLDGAKVAVCVFNKSKNHKNVKVDLGKISNLGFVDLPVKGSYEVFDAWEKNTFTASNDFSAELPGHGVKVYIIK